MNKANVVVALRAQLDGVASALDAAYATLALLAEEADEHSAPPVATDDPNTCEHPPNFRTDALDQTFCGSCGKNLSA